MSNDKDVPLAEHYRAVAELIASVPAAAKAAFGQAAGIIADAGDRGQIPPDQMLAAAGALLGSVLVCNMDPRDEAEVNRRIALAIDAMQVSTATLRINAGVFEARPDGSLGIRTDA